MNNWKASHDGSNGNIGSKKPSPVGAIWVKEFSVPLLNLAHRISFKLKRVGKWVSEYPLDSDKGISAAASLPQDEA